MGYVDQNDLLSHDINQKKMSSNQLIIGLEDEHNTVSQFKSSEYTSDEEEESEEEDELKIRLSHDEIK